MTLRELCQEYHLLYCVDPLGKAGYLMFNNFSSKNYASGNSLFVVEHELDVIRHADWIVDVGPTAGENGGQILYSGPPQGLASVAESRTRPYLFAEEKPRDRIQRTAHEWLRLEGVTRNNLQNLSVAFPLRTLAAVTGVSGSGKSSLVSQVLVELVGEHLGEFPPVRWGRSRSARRR